MNNMNLSYKEKQEIRKNLQENENSLRVYKHKLYQHINRTVRIFCSDAIDNHKINPAYQNIDPFTSSTSSISSIDIHRMRVEKLNKDIEFFSEYISKNVGMMIEIALGKDTGTQELSTEKISRYDILDLRKEK